MSSLLLAFLSVTQKHERSLASPPVPQDRLSAGNQLWEEGGTHSLPLPCLSEDTGTLRKPTVDPIPPGSRGAPLTCLPPAGGDRAQCRPGARAHQLTHDPPSPPTVPQDAPTACRPAHGALTQNATSHSGATPLSPPCRGNVPSRTSCTNVGNSEHQND